MISEINTILKLSNTLKILNYIKTAVTVGIIGYTVFQVFKMYRDNSPSF